jgi:hypothetical protein
MNHSEIVLPITFRLARPFPCRSKKNKCAYCRNNQYKNVYDIQPIHIHTDSTIFNTDDEEEKKWHQGGKCMNKRRMLPFHNFI